MRFRSNEPVETIQLEGHQRGHEVIPGAGLLMSCGEVQHYVYVTLGLRLQCGMSSDCSGERQI